MNSLLSASFSSMGDSIDGDSLLRSVTINNLHEFEEIVHNNAQRITKPTPPPLYYGIGPYIKDFQVNHLLDEKFIVLPDCDGLSCHNDFVASRSLKCNCDFTSEYIAKLIFATQESCVCYLRDKSFRAPKDNSTLRFESRFESGNLYAAERVKTCKCGQVEICENYPAVSYETYSNSITLDGINRKKTLFQPWEQVYELFLAADSNSTSHSQWFSFVIDNMIPGVEYTFVMPNFVKRSSSYNQGMQILFADLDGDCKWQRAGYDVVYGPNKQYAVDKTHFLYKYASLVFKVVFARRTRFHVAYHFPYSYSKVQLYLNSKIAIYNSEQSRDFLMTAKTIYHTIMGNDIDVITITYREFEGVKAVKQRPILLVLARIHPGESYSSYIFEGILDHCMSDLESARLLRENFIIKMIPMLNPDGVIIGNYRCNYEGIDLNRKWHMSSQAVTPEIYAVHYLLQELTNYNSRVELFVDIHGHFKKQNVFAYSTYRIKYLEVLNYHSANFSMADCYFGIGKGKEHTGRVECQTRYGIPQSICIESSFYSITKNGEHKLISYYLLREIGAEIAHTLLFLAHPDMSEFKINAYLSVSDYQSEYQPSDDSGEDVDVLASKKGYKQFSYFNYIRKNIGVQLLTKDTFLKHRHSYMPPKLPRTAKKSNDDFFRRMAQPIKAKACFYDSEEEVKVEASRRVTASQQYRATDNLLRMRRPQSSTVHTQPVRIIYEHTFDLQQEKIAFERQFYRPKMPICQVYQHQWTDASKRAEAIRMIRSRGYDVIPQKFELE